LLWDGVEERHKNEVEEAQKKAIAEYREEHPEMGEDALHVDLPGAAGGASGSKGPRRRGRPVLLYDRIEPLRLARDPDVNHGRQLLEAARRHHVGGLGAGIGPMLQFTNGLAAHPEPEIPEIQLPLPQRNIPNLHPVRAVQRRREAQETLQQNGEDLGQHREENWVLLRRLAQQQRVLAGKFAGNNLKNPRPAVLPHDSIHSAPRIRGNRTGGTGMDRERVNEWRKGVPGPGDDAAL